MILRFLNYRLDIELAFRLSKLKALKPKTGKPYSGIFCEVCGEKVKGGHKGKHLIENHPEYACQAVRVGNNPFPYLAYRCSTCGQTVSGVSTMIKHYQETHPEKLKIKKLE